MAVDVRNYTYYADRGLVEDEETGSQVYRYVKTGTNHFSFAFTYDCIAWSGERPGGGASALRVGRLTDEEIAEASPGFSLLTEF